MGRVLIVGSGLMGSGIASCAALAGNSAVLNDVDAERLEKGLASAIKCVDELAAQGLAEPESAAAAKGRLSTSLDLGAECGKADLVIEAIVENLGAKQVLFEKLDALTPETVPILSNTSGLRITEIAARAKHPERTMTAHFWFPAHLVPLVEVVMSESTDRGMAQSVKELLCGWGKAAVLVRRDTPGQLANRVLQAVIREATNIVDIGLASAEDVDLAIKMGMGIRFPVWGPLEHIDAVGLDLGYSVQNTVLPEISDSKKPADGLKAHVERGELGFKTGSGYYDWNQKSMEELAGTRNDFIVHALKFMKARGLV